MAEELLPNLNPATAGKYFATKATIEFSGKRGQELDQEAKTQTNANYFYNRGATLRAEPNKLRSSLNAANSAGLAESGTLARNQGQIQTDFAQKQGRLAEMRRNAVNKISNDIQSKKVETGLKLGEALGTANSEQLQYLKENPLTPAAAPAVTTPSGKPFTVVSSKQQPSSGGPRRTAAKKVAGRFWGVG